MTSASVTVSSSSEMLFGFSMSFSFERFAANTPVPVTAESTDTAATAAMICFLLFMIKDSFLNSVNEELRLYCLMSIAYEGGNKKVG